MSNDRLTELEHRLALAEHEVRTTRAQVRELQQHAQRRVVRGRRDGWLGLVALVLVFSVAQALQTDAQWSGQTVKAPFTVLDAANRTIFSVTDGVHRGVEIRRTDGKAFVQLWDEGASIRGPLAVTDNAEKAIAIVQDSSVTTVKDVKGVEQAVTSSRGLHILNAKGDTAVRAAVIATGDGYVSARKAGQGTGLGGIQAVVYSDQGGSHIKLSGMGGKFNAQLSTDEHGLMFVDDAGVALAEINRTHFWLGDGAGNSMVEAGMLPDKRGVVRVGPRAGGPQGPSGPASMLVGRK
jgi:hypothetical protein